MQDSSSAPFAQLLSLIDRTWGFRALRPLQEQAMQAVLARRDSLVVMPTGGGKSLCFQAPALLREDETTIVISPLIALMKDQVDSLRAANVPARFVNSSLTPDLRLTTFEELKARKVRLLYASPERLMVPAFQTFLHTLGVKTFAIDEAHCISHWGHDFRPEYRQLASVRAMYPEATFHGYTATATEQVRADIVAQLGLRNPELLVGNFDRPNLCYRVIQRVNLLEQVLEILRRHKGEAGIIYCIRRADVDELTAALKENGIAAQPYHAGMPPESRKKTQEEFRSEKCDLIVATVAFGMGIDRSNVRYVLHAGMPKTIEHYQQEAGRAGRDGLEAECVLLFGGRDPVTWEKIIEKSAESADVAPDFLPNAIAHIQEMARYCRGSKCRHRVLVEHFGQRFESPNCRACDLCLDEFDEEPQSQEIARKILSCVARVKEGFGVGQVVRILMGEMDEKVTKYRHEQLSTFGLLKQNNVGQIRDWTYQLIDQGMLDQTEGEYPILKLNALSWQILRNERQVTLRKTDARKKTKKSRAEETSWEGIDRDLFERLREWRKAAADMKDLPAYAVFGDRTLRELAAVRPSNEESLRRIHGVGESKSQTYGSEVLEIIASECRDRGLSLDNFEAAPPRTETAEIKPVSDRAHLYFSHFRKRATLEQVMQRTSRAMSTVVKYLCEFIESERPASIDDWVPKDHQTRVMASARKLGSLFFKPIFEDLSEQVSYDSIRITVAYFRADLENSVQQTS